MLDITAYPVYTKGTLRTPITRIQQMTYTHPFVYGMLFGIFYVLVDYVSISAGLYQ
jgi:hypothetical protein|tara:strand:+ start:222 stop:389 length:168 start_codon:yes stop_codon:yes gene_type:complete